MAAGSNFAAFSAVGGCGFRDGPQCSKNKTTSGNRRASVLMLLPLFALYNSVEVEGRGDLSVKRCHALIA